MIRKNKTLKLNYKVEALVKINVVIEWNKFRNSFWYEILNRLCKLFSKRYGSLNEVIIIRSSRSHLFFKIDVLKNFTIFTGKNLCWNLFLMKLQAFRPSEGAKAGGCIRTIRMPQAHHCLYLGSIWPTKWKSWLLEEPLPTSVKVVWKKKLEQVNLP